MKKSIAELTTYGFQKHIVNYELLNHLQTVILPSLQKSDQHDLRSLAKCNKTLIPLSTEFGQHVDVHVMKAEQGNSAKFWGLGHCGNPFYCPVCEAHRMGLHALKIAAAIEGLEKKQGKVAFMLTLTIIHHKNLFVEDTTDILFDAWTRFKSRHGGSSVMTTKADRHNPMMDFVRHFNCTESLRVFEITYREKKGWNPHFHCLFWVNENQLQEVAKWEQHLRDYWQKCLAKAWAKHFAKKYIDKHNDFKANPEYWMKVFNRLHGYAFYRKQNSTAHTMGLWISKNKDGSIRKAVTSDYICGWGADSEVTGGNRKHSKAADSVTPYELLQKSSEGDFKSRLLFTKYMLHLRHHRRRRVMYSKTLVKFIREYMETHEFKLDTLKKTKADQQTWFPLLSVTKQQWHNLLNIESAKKLHLRSDILFLAANYNAEKAYQLIYDHLIFFGIKINKPTGFWAKFCEDLFNKCKNDAFFEKALEQEKAIFGQTA